MTVKLDEISRAIGALEASTKGLQGSFDKHCLDDDRRHNENIAVQREANESIRKLTEVVTPLALAVDAMRPAVANYQASRFKLIGAAGVVMLLLGFVVWALQLAANTAIQYAIKRLTH